MTTTAVDIVVKVNGTAKIDKLNRALKGLGDSTGTAGKSLPKVAAAAKTTGTAAKGAAGGVRSFGAAVSSALGPIGLVAAALGGLKQGFDIIAQSDFAAAKVRTLGVDAEELQGRLKDLKGELAGQRSQAELLGAAYDVASAGFTKAADTAEVLKAASQAATGGFAELNTVGNALTSVLNAYQLSASEATSVVDKFIQTQNDGKIVVAQYADNIGKVASAAAGLKIPLDEVNAAIAQSTAAGVKSEIAFTGLKSALARLASGEAEKALSDYGIEINAATIEADGLLGTLKKLEGLDTGQLFKALGTEAAPALLPVIQNLEKFEQLLENQKNSAGAAAKAQETAANTIQGAWNKVSTAFSDLFSDQSELGVLAIALFEGLAYHVGKFGEAINFVLAPFKALIEIAIAVGTELDKVFGFTDRIEKYQKAVKEVAARFEAAGQAFKEAFLDKIQAGLETLQQRWNQFTQYLSDAWNTVTQFLQNAWDNAIGVIDSVLANFGTSVQDIFNFIGEAWTKLTNFMSEIWTKFIRNAIVNLINLSGPITLLAKAAGFDVGEAFVSGIEAAGAAFSSFEGVGSAPSAGGGGSGSTPPTVPTGGSAGGGGSKGRKGKDPVEEAAKLERKVAELTNRATELGEKLGVAFASKSTPLEEGILGVKRELAGADKELEEMLMKLDELTKGDPKFAAARSQINAIREQLAATDELRVASERLTQSDKEGLGKSVRELEQKLQLLREGRTEFTELEKLQIKYGDDWEKLDPTVRGHLEQLAATKEALKGNIKQAEKQLEQQKKIKEMFNSISQSVGAAIENSIVAAIDSAVDSTKDLGQALQEIASSLLKDVGRMLIRGGIQAAGSGFGLPGFSAGGRPEVGRASIVGENGPELFTPDTAGRIDGAEAFNAARQAMTTSSTVQSSTAALDREQEQIEMMNNPSPLDVRFETYSIGGMDVVTRDEAMKISEQSAKKARAQVFADMRNKPATRKQLGMV